MPSVPGLRSHYDKVGRIVHFGRMLDKIRLHAARKLPEPYHANLGIGFDGRCCAFLGVGYQAVKGRTLEGGANLSLVLTLNVVLLSCYTLGCHSLRHLVGGSKDVEERNPP